VGRDRGSVLILMPAAVLVLVVLGAIAVDLSVAFLGQRELANAAEAAANDVAGTIDAARFRSTGAVVIDCAQADAVAHAAFRARLAGWMQAADVTVTSCAGNTVTITAAGRVGYIFARAIPGAPHTASVQATATASAETG
jgi:Flp pilus assembly protein TadG